MVAETTLEAFEVAKFEGTISTMQEKVLNIVAAFGPEGCISEEVLSCTVKPGSYANTGTITTRLSELERKGLIYREGDTRNAYSGRRQWVWRHITYCKKEPKLPIEKKSLNGFDKGVIYCAKLIAKSTDLGEARRKILAELEKIKEKSA